MNNIDIFCNVEDFIEREAALKEVLVQDSIETLDINNVIPMLRACCTYYDEFISFNDISIISVALQQLINRYIECYTLENIISVYDKGIILLRAVLLLTKSNDFEEIDTLLRQIIDNPYTDNRLMDEVLSEK